MASYALCSCYVVLTPLKVALYPCQQHIATFNLLMHCRKCRLQLPCHHLWSTLLPHGPLAWS